MNSVRDGIDGGDNLSETIDGNVKLFHLSWCRGKRQGVGASAFQHLQIDVTDVVNGLVMRFGPEDSAGGLTSDRVFGVPSSTWRRQEVGGDDGRKLGRLSSLVCGGSTETPTSLQAIFFQWKVTTCPIWRPCPSKVSTLGR